MDMLLVSLVSIFVGWFLAQFTAMFQNYLYRLKIKKYLIEELKEIQQELERTLLIYSRQLQIFALKGVDHGTPIHLSDHIFKNYYKDAILSLNIQQRISFQMIHSYIETINAGIDEHNKITDELHRKNVLKGPGSITEEEGTLWGNGVKAGFTNVATAIWHIKFHLNNQRSPNLMPYTEDHKQYLQYLESVEKEISKIIEAAKKFSREDFEKIYNPKSFAGKFF